MPEFFKDWLESLDEGQADQLFDYFDGDPATAASESNEILAKKIIQG